MVNSDSITKSDLVLREPVIGARRISNYFWASVILFGAIGFLSVGISSYLGSDILPFLSSKGILFLPQGLVMSFYGIAGLFLSIYLWLTIFWKIGEGYNEFNREEQIVRIFRWGFPGKNRRIQITCPITDVYAVRVQVKEGINPQRAIYLRVKGRPDIPLTRAGQPLSLEEVEEKAAELARFLQVSIEGV
uniref:hypothetical chloroplast RF4 n=1 Tax=Streptofilum capillatum TaxID=2058781 RepID=UPI00286D25AB|nr:hypothetical chloroplast RF4 [Streptofilum capillatum]WKT08546.1 hypothetical chloroplast RF4 [Streptofilum capillatum]WKT08645.1 hypothetical chloroplast RF4 [Streptofilum sp. BC4-VF8pt]WKT08744.1 hypothetical chloroplast RF4 [Streptofilum sp. ZNP2-VF4pt]